MCHECDGLPLDDETCPETHDGEHETEYYDECCGLGLHCTLCGKQWEDI